MIVNWNTMTQNADICVKEDSEKTIRVNYSVDTNKTLSELRLIAPFLN